MKAWSIFLFIYVFQFIVGAMLGLYGITDANSVVNITEFDSESEGQILSSDNQYAEATTYQEKKFGSGWQTLIQALMPTGYYISRYFPTFPSFLILLFNSLWGIVTTIAVIEFMRGFNITGTE